MLAHVTKASYIYIYISSYMKIEIFDRKSEKDLIVFGKMNGGGDGSRYCLRAYVNAMCWSPLKGSQWKIGDFISTLHPSYYVYPILFFISFFPNSNRWKFPSTDHPPPFVYLRHSRHLLHDHHRKLSTALSRAILLGSHDRR